MKEILTDTLSVGVMGDGRTYEQQALLSLQVLGEILMLAGFFTFPEKKLDKLTIYSYNKANFR
jgi:GMP synthase PP-ATPase subunit